MTRQKKKGPTVPVSLDQIANIASAFYTADVAKASAEAFYASMIKKIKEDE